MKISSSELVIGTRYWLDSEKDVSGIFIGGLEEGNVDFNEIQGKRRYAYVYDDKTIIGFDANYGGVYYTVG